MSRTVAIVGAARAPVGLLLVGAGVWELFGWAYVALVLGALLLLGALVDRPGGVR